MERTSIYNWNARTALWVHTNKAEVVARLLERFRPELVESVCISETVGFAGERSMECLEGLARAVPRRVVLVDVGWRAGAMRARWLRMMARFGGGTAVGWSGLGDWGADVGVRLCLPGEDVRGLVGVEESRAGLVESERVILESGKEMHLEVLMWEEFGGVAERVLSEVVGR